MAINERLIHTDSDATAGSGNQEEGLILHLDANDVDSFDGTGTVWYDISDHEFTPSVNPEEYFNTVLYTGDDSNNRAITGVGFQPDLVWIKNRSSAYSHMMYDSVRGAEGSGGDHLSSDTTGSAGAVVTSLFDSFDADGFTIDKASSSRVNEDGDTYVAWCFKAGGAPSGSDKVSIDGTSYSTMTAAGLTDGTEAIDKLSVNTKLGFSIVKYTAPALRVDTVAHGLGETPEMIILKSTSVARNWNVFHKDVGTSKNLHLNTTDAANTSEDWTANSTTFSIQDYSSSADWIAYCFTSKRGVSKVGEYDGSYSSTPTEVYTGFEPAFVLVKSVNAAGSWSIHDNKRGVDKQLNPNIINAETSGWSSHIEFTRDGFTVKGTSSGLNPNNRMLYFAVAKNTKETQLTPEKGNFTAEGTVTTGAELEFNANDYSGSGNWLNTGYAGYSDGTITGASYVNDGTSDYFSFDGTDYITSSSSGLTANTYTIEAWFYMDSLQTAGIVSWGDQGTNYERRSMITWNGGSGSNYYLYSSTYASNIRGNTPLTPGRWYHGVITMDNGQANIYLNGEHDGSGTNTLSAYTSSTLYIGRTAEASEIFDGNIAIARVYDTVLTSAQIKANYDATYGLYQHANLALHLDAASYSGSGSTWTADEGSDGTITGATYNDELGNYFDFDGNDSITSAGNLSVPNENFTVEFWTRPDSTSTSQNFFEIEDTSGNRRVSMVVNTGSTFRCYIYEASGFNNSAFPTSTTTFDTGKWYHVVVTFEKGVAAKMYINGELNVTSTTNISAARPTTYGETNIGTGAFGSLTGAIGQFRFYNTVLSAEAIRQNFNYTKSSYPNGMHFVNAGGRANWLPEGSFNFDTGQTGGEYFTIDSNSRPFLNALGYGPFAVSAWVNPDEVTSSWRVIIGTQGYSDGSNNGWQLYANQDDIKFWISVGSNTEVVTLNGVLTAGTWSHVLIQRTSTKWEGYIDGSLVSNASSANETVRLTDDLGHHNPSDAVLIIGRNWQNTNYQWDGRISEVKIYNKSLSADKIQAEYNKGQFGDN